MVSKCSHSATSRNKVGHVLCCMCLYNLTLNETAQEAEKRYKQQVQEMKAYILWDNGGVDEGPWVYGIYSTWEKAKFAKKFNIDLFIEEVTLDQYRVDHRASIN